jgi:hypothetical protein
MFRKIRNLLEGHKENQGNIRQDSGSSDRISYRNQRCELLACETRGVRFRHVWIGNAPFVLCVWTRQLSPDIPVNAGHLCDKDIVMLVGIKRTPCVLNIRTQMQMNKTTKLISLNDYLKSRKKLYFINLSDLKTHSHILNQYYFTVCLIGCGRKHILRMHACTQTHKSTRKWRLNMHTDPGSILT